MSGERRESPWGVEPVLSDLEAMMWRAEADPRLRSTGIFVDVLDRAPDWDRLLRAHEWAIALVPRLRQRVVDDAIGINSPTWVLDHDFDLSYHLRRVRLPAPGTFDQVLALAQTTAMTPLDRARPLWEATLVEGQSDGGAAYLLKMHHCLTDGQAGIQLFDLLHSDTPALSSRTDRLVTTRDPEPAPDPAVRIIRAVADTTRALTSAAGGLGLSLLRRPELTVSSSVRMARSLARVTGPPPAKPSRPDGATGSVAAIRHDRHAAHVAARRRQGRRRLTE